MQASGSFELARNGRKRPTNLLTSRPSNSDFQCFSPSFNPAHSSASQSPNRADDLPPTPITAGMPKDQPIDHRSQEAGASRVTLPGISDLLRAPAAASPVPVLTPPCSGRMGSLAPLIGSNAEEEDEGRFQGPRPSWVREDSEATFVGVRPPVSRQSSLETKRSTVSPRYFGSMEREQESSGLVGLGFAMSDATPRIGCFGSNALGLHTPKQDDYAQWNHAPSAPSVAQEGRFESTVPSSPICPPLHQWNTDLRTPASKAVKSQHLGYARDRPASIAMQREQPVVLECTPTQDGVMGLGVSLSGNTRADFSRPAAEYRVASTSAVRLDGPATLPPRNAADIRPHVAPPASATGLTPSLSMARIQDVDVAAPLSPSSPSLRARSKKRSDLVRRQAEAAVLAGLTTKDPATDSPSSAPASDGSTDSTDAMLEEPFSGSSAIPSSPRKRALSQRDANSTSTTKSAKTSGKSSPGRTDSPSSPWGVFRLKEEGWKPLGPPGGGKGVGINAVVKGSSAAAAAAKKQKRLTVSGASRPASRESSDQNKENNVPGGKVPGGKKSISASGGKRPSTANGRMGDVFGAEQNHAGANVKHNRFAQVQTASSRPSSAHGLAPKKRSPTMSVR